ncbi:hypothetical protein M8C13_38370 [Crossiella sp. SN42]|nr:hypothetical protein [Crossiella sp. SN42]MCO1581631.1 hypothetical protein [Crossiella sp. SN42]
MITSCSSRWNRAEGQVRRWATRHGLTGDAATAQLLVTLEFLVVAVGCRS